MAENNKNRSNFVAPLTKIYREKIKKSKDVKPTLIQEEEKQISQSQQNQQPSQVTNSQQQKQSFSSNISDATITSSIKQGFIKKYVNVMSGFKKRYFVLTNELLIYYKEKKGQVSEKGQISLKLAKIDPRTMNDKKMNIGTGMSEIFLEFNTIQEKKEWLVAIDECKKRLSFNQSLLGDINNNNEQSELEETKKQIDDSIKRRMSASSAPQSQQKINAKVSQGLDLEVKQALNAALQANIIKEDSALSVHLGDTWAAHMALEDAMNKFKQELQLQGDKLPQNLVNLGMKIENASNDLKQTVTNSIQVIEKTKLEIIKILEVQDEMLKKQSTVVDEKGYLGEDSRFMSFSQEFNDLIEHKRNIKSDIFGAEDNDQNNEAIEQIRHSRLNRPSLQKLTKIDENEEDDFFDAVGDQETLEHAQQEIQKCEEVKSSSSKSDEEQEYRTILPALKPPDQKVSVWKVIKDAIGKDITRFCVPVYFNEPISMLQKVSEIMEYESLLVKASEEQNQFKRLMYVAAFGVVQYKCSDKRLCKPFNPILGETFELKRPNYLFFSEQVSHHPPVSACFAYSDSYEFWMNTSMKTNFWGKSLEIKPFGYQNVRLKTTQERFTIERPTSSVNNLIFGEMYVEHSGTMTVRNLQTQDYCEIEFKKRGWGGKNAYEVEGHCFNKYKDKMWKISGKWIESLIVKDLYAPEEFAIWQANPLPKNSDSMYNFTYFTLQLNYLPPGLKERLPPSDSRLRPDQRALENGDLIKAASEKARLEDKQRKMRKEREQQGVEYQSYYFEEFIDPETQEKGYKYIRDYWQDRENKEWTHIQELF